MRIQMEYDSECELNLRCKEYINLVVDQKQRNENHIKLYLYFLDYDIALMRRNFQLN